MHTPQPTNPIKTPKPSRIDMQAVAHGQPQALAQAVADLAARLYLRAGYSIKLPMGAVDVALLNGPQAGLLAAAVELCELLACSPQGRQALHDFGFKPLLEHFKSE